MLTYGGWALEREECETLKRVICRRGWKSCVEFGAGISTVAIAEVLGRANIWSYETRDETIRCLEGYQLLVRDLRSPLTALMIREDRAKFGRDAFDFAFVDGPPSYEPALLEGGRYARWHSVSAAMEFSDAIILHDAARPGEQATIRALLDTWSVEDLESERGMKLFTRR